MIKTGKEAIEKLKQQGHEPKFGTVIDALFIAHKELPNDVFEENRIVFEAYLGDTDVMNSDAITIKDRAKLFEIANFTVTLLEEHS